MVKTKWNIGDIVFLPCKVVSINVDAEDDDNIPYYEMYCTYAETINQRFRVWDQAINQDFEIVSPPKT